jgi:Flp pilus assembly protein TadG
MNAPRLPPRSGRRRRLRRTAIGKAFADRCGIAVIEFAFALPVFLVFVIGLIEFSRVLWTSNALQLAVDQAARYAVANPSATSDQITEYAAGQMVSIDATHVTLTVSRETAGGVDFVTIVASLPYDSITHLVPIGSITLTGESRVPLTG